MPLHCVRICYTTMNKKDPILDLSKLECAENDVKGNSEGKKKAPIK